MPKYWYDHVHLFSPDPRKAAKFYQDMFQATLVSNNKDDAGNIRVVLKMGDTRILIFNSKARAGLDPKTEPYYGINHFGIRTDNLEAAVAELKKKGVHFTDEIRVAASGSKISFLTAPDNVRIELLETGA